MALLSEILAPLPEIMYGTGFTFFVCDVSRHSDGFTPGPHVTVRTALPMDPHSALKTHFSASPKPPLLYNRTLLCHLSGHLLSPQTENSVDISFTN